MRIIKICISSSKKPSFTRASRSAMSFLKSRIKNDDFNPKKGGIIDYFDNKNSYTIFAHVGLSKDLINDDYQILGAKIYRRGISFHKSGDIKMRLFFQKGFSLNARFFVEKGFLMAQMKDDFFKSKEDSDKENKKGKIILEGIFNKKLFDVVEGIDVARFLIAQPSNIVDPNYLEKYIKENLEKGKDLKITYFGQKEIEKEKMNLFVAVNRGAKDDAKMIIMEYNKSGNKNEDPIILIGKGLTYDSGGYYFKTYPHMNDMHGDMSGCASVIGIMSVLKKLGMKKRVIGIVGITENMVDANSYKNGDIYKGRNGKSVEILHTDAEGRLVLADILSYAFDKYNPKLVIDIATLTGACHSALGEMYTGIFSGDQKLIKKFDEIGQKVNDLVWALPFDKYCFEAIKGKMTDVCNSSNLQGLMGASTAAAFLANFVKDTKKWIHLDVAGSALRSKMRKAYDLPHGLGTGSTIHLLLEYLSATHITR